MNITVVSLFGGRRPRVLIINHSRRASLSKCNVLNILTNCKSLTNENDRNVKIHLEQ